MNAIYTDWKSIDHELPPEGLVVDTCIEDDRGFRNHQPLVRKGGLLFFPDMSMYVYYRPTHWRHVATLLEVK